MNKAIWILLFLILGMVIGSPLICVVAALMYCKYLVERSTDKAIDDFVREQREHDEEHWNG